MNIQKIFQTISWGKVKALRCELFHVPIREVLSGIWKRIWGSHSAYLRGSFRNAVHGWRARRESSVDSRFLPLVGSMIAQCLASLGLGLSEVEAFSLLVQV